MAQRMNSEVGTEGLLAAGAEEKDLALAFKAGEKGAYQAIHERYATRVEGVCRRMLGNPSDAQEAVQETFLRVYQALGRFNGRYQLGAWITRIATNVCLDHLRARSRRPSDPVPNEVLVLDESHADLDAQPEEMVLRNAESRHVRKVLAELPPMHRAAIVLRDFEGLSYEEVAVALQITECQTKALIHRARQNFKRSWTRSLSALLPWRLVEKVRGLDNVARDHTAEVVSVTQSVTSCTSMLQQCGQYVGQHVATVVTAAIVGTAAGAASHAATAPARPEESRPRVTSAYAQRGPSRSYKVLSQTTSKKVEAHESKIEKEVRPTMEGVAPTPAEPTPAPESTPTTPPTPSSEPSPTDLASPAPQPDESPRAAPQPFAPAIGFDYGRAVPNRTPRAHTAAISCTSDELEQRVETVVEDDDSSVTYPALLQLHWGAATSQRLSMEFTVWKNGHEIYYSGTGELVDGSYPEGQRKVNFVGNYGTLNEQAKSMDLPTSGRFTASLTLDCAALSVITESVVLGA